MAETRDSSELAFYQPTQRGIFDLKDTHIPRRFARWLRHAPLTFRLDQDFAAIIAQCAAVPRTHEAETWINRDIEEAFIALHHEGHAHCLGAYDLDGTLVGGLYGLHMGAVFFGESMFSLVPNASKACLVTLFQVLSEAGFALIDAQMPNPHLDQFGLQIWPNDDFLEVLPPLLAEDCSFPDQSALQSTTQTS